MKYSVLMVMLLGLGACDAGSDGRDGPESREQLMAKIEGSVLYRERIMLRPGSELTVQLEDVSMADAPATIITAETMVLEGGPPYSFVLEYDPAGIDERMRYALRAKISNGERLLFTNDKYIDPFAGSPVEILVRSVPAPSPGAFALEGVRWGLVTLAGEKVAAGAGGNPVDIQFAGGDMRVSGFSGCNNYSGGYSREGVSQHGSALKIGPTASTMKACPDGMELEQNYQQMLNNVNAFRLQDDRLVLMSGPEELATFKALE
jgi:putative lipoprotein